MYGRVMSGFVPHRPFFHNVPHILSMMRRRPAQTLARWVLWCAVTIAVVVAAAYVLLRVIRPAVTITEAAQGPVVQAFYSTGTVEPVREYPIKSNAAGILTEVH